MLQLLPFETRDMAEKLLVDGEVRPLEALDRQLSDVVIGVLHQPGLYLRGIPLGRTEELVVPVHDGLKHGVHEATSTSAARTHPVRLGRLPLPARQIQDQVDGKLLPLGLGHGGARPRVKGADEVRQRRMVGLDVSGQDGRADAEVVGSDGEAVRAVRGDDAFPELAHRQP